jgi:hypothetical protein
VNYKIYQGRAGFGGRRIEDLFDLLAIQHRRYKTLQTGPGVRRAQFDPPSFCHNLKMAEILSLQALG